MRSLPIMNGTFFNPRFAVTAGFNEFADSCVAYVTDEQGKKYHLKQTTKTKEEALSLINEITQSW